MSNLYVLLETYTNGYKIEALSLVFFASVFCATFVIISKNPIVSVLFLIGLFVSIAGYLAILDVTFIALSYLLVYVGAVSILFLFILMLINIRVSELTSDTSNSIPLALMVGFIFYYAIYDIIPNKTEKNIPDSIKDFLDFVKNDELKTTSWKTWENNLIDMSHINTLGNIMYTNYFIWLILSSIILLLAMVGAIIITIKQN